MKEKLLSEHTLEAVLSMPDELFFNSKVGVVSCVMIFTAHRPHPANKETYFGYYKDDGFVKRKVQGRYDAFGLWEGINEKWVSSFLNRKQEAGLSVNKIVSANDEWATESYMATDYGCLNDEGFVKTLLRYSTFLFSNSIRDRVSSGKQSISVIPINTNDWRLFILDSLFDITGSKTTPILDLEEYGIGKYPFVTTQATNNGVEGFYNYYTEAGNVLTIDSAVLGHCTYQAFNFSASDHVEKLVPKFEMNAELAMFLVTVLNLEKYRYNYGRKASQSRMKKVFVKLPVTEGGNPNWGFMENYIKSLSYSSSI